MENTAKNFALQLGSLVSLYVSIGALIGLLFGIITVTYPDVAQGYWEVESAASSIRFTIALLIVFFPTYIALTRFVNNIRRNEHGAYLALTKWLIYLSLLVGGATMLGDLVWILNSFLNGEITIRFILKALAFLIVVGGAFIYYLYDARGYWQEHEKQSIQYSVGATVVVLVALITGFMHTETPAQVREMKLDTVQITDLQYIQSRVLEYYQLNSMLPQSLIDAFNGLDVPKAPENRTTYEYRIVDVDTVEMCAVFAFPSSETEKMQYAPTPYADQSGIKNANNWTHTAGRWCFTRMFSKQPNPNISLKQ
jgi:hypothetical protein